MSTEVTVINVAPEPGPRAGCRFCDDAQHVSDPTPAELHQTCDSCLNSRTDDAIWDETYARLCGHFLTRRYAVLRGIEVNHRLEQGITRLLQDMDEDTGVLRG